MTSPINSAAVPLSSIFDPYVAGTTKARATGIYENGVDLCNLYANIIYGSAASATGVKSQSADVNTLFAKIGTAVYNTPLPINGNTYSAQSQSATVSTSCSYSFASNGSGWALSGTSSSGGAVTPGSSGSLPTGAATIQTILTVTTSSGTGSTTNTASSPQPVTASSQSSVTATSAPSGGESESWATLVINYYNSGGSNISSTTIYLKATATGTA